MMEHASIHHMINYDTAINQSKFKKRKSLINGMYNKTNKKNINI